MFEEMVEQEANNLRSYVVKQQNLSFFQRNKYDIYIISLRVGLVVGLAVMWYFVLCR